MLPTSLQQTVEPFVAYGGLSSPAFIVLVIGFIVPIFMLARSPFLYDFFAKTFDSNLFRILASMTFVVSCWIILFGVLSSFDVTKVEYYSGEVEYVLNDDGLVVIDGKSFDIEFEDQALELQPGDTVNIKGNGGYYSFVNEIPEKYLP